MPGPDAAVRAVFFDAVGTLLLPEPSPIRVYTAAARSQGVILAEAEVRHRFWKAFQEEEEADRRAGWRVDEAREVLRWRHVVTATLAEVPDQEQCFGALWEHFSRPDSWRAHPEAAAVLDTLVSRGLVVGIASNFDSRLRAVLEGLPALAAVRRRCVISSLVGWRKPARAFFQAVVNAAGCSASAVLFVGDHPANDLEGARSAGLRSLLFDPEGKAGVATHLRSLREIV